MDRIEQVSRNRVQNAIRSGAITVNGKQVKPNHKVGPGESIRLVIPRNPNVQPLRAEDIPLDIRYEDDDLLVVYKPAGLVVHPGVGNYTGTLVNGLLHHYQSIAWPSKDVAYRDRPGLVHRIDKDTTGLLVVAKTEYALTHLAKQFFDHTVERTYNAIVWGQPDELKGTIEGHVGRHPKNRLEMTVFPDGDMGKHAITHYEVLEPMYYVSLVQCKLETGRTHQIRIHMKHQGHPLFGDRRYGKYKQFVHNCLEMMPRQALHAKSLGFEHPVTGKRLHFETELPEDMVQLLDKWRTYLTYRKDSM
ncbi:UNVERIFIED_CONTAM: hypothetical protein GTU68_047117 [Idotea baltica]|nr:hypothetical protein [Idotea baltica]